MDIDLTAGLVSEPPKRKGRLPELISFLEENKLKPGSTTGGHHNRGSKHYTENAVDIKDSGRLDLSHLNSAAAARGFKLRDERARPKGQKVWGGAHWHLEADDGINGIDLSAGLDTSKPTSEIDLSAGLESVATKANPFVKAKGSVGAKRPRPNQPAGMGDVQQASRIRVPTLAEAEEPLRTKPIGFNRRGGQPSRITQTEDELRVTKGEQPSNKQGYARQQEAQARLGQMKDLGLQHHDPVKEEQWKTANEREITALTEGYKGKISRAGKLNTIGGQWGSEAAAKTVAGWLEPLAGATGSDSLRINVEAIHRAAMELGANRNQASQVVNDTISGLAASAPEFAAMAAGLPPALVFGGGGALHAGGRGEDPNIGAVSGVGQAMAFDIPVPQAVSKGLPGAVSKTLATGAGSTLSEVAMGKPLNEAAMTGLNTGLMRGVPEAIRLRPRGERNASQQKVSTVDRENYPPSQVAETEVPVSTEAKPRDIPVQPESNVRGVPVEHHSATQPRRARNTASGTKGQFKKGKPAETELEHRAAKMDEDAPTPQQLARIREEIDAEQALVTPESKAADAAEFDRIWGTTPAGKEVIPPTRATEGAASEAAPSIKLKARSFPSTVREAGYKAEDSTYEVLGNKETVAKANATIKEKGIDLAVAELGGRKEFTPEDVAVGSRAIQEYEKSGQMDKALSTVETLAENLTKAGQTVQAASIIARLSPEGTLLYAQRKLPKGVKLKPEQGEKLVAKAKKVREADLKIGTLNERLEQMQKEAKQPRAKVGTLADRLNKFESEARARLAERAAKAKAEVVGDKGQRGAGVNPAEVGLDIADFAIIGAAKLARKGVTLAKWTDEMVKEFGEEIRPRMKAIYKDSYKLYDDQRKQFSQEATERSARRAEPNAKDIQAVINERALARKDARTHKAELSRLFKDLSLTKYGKVKAVAGDVLNVPRTLKSSVDLSAPRQGAMWMINHPVQGAKTFFGKQLRAMREVNYDRFVDQLESDPDYALMTRSGLALTTTDVRPHSLSGREEAFMSRIAGSLPGVKQSERAYTTFLDTARSSWFKQLKTQAENRAKAEGKTVTPEQHQAIANFVNIATGRGNLGKGWLNNSAPFLNAVFFAPKFAASKVQIFDPRVYSRLPKGARKTAMREAATYFGAMTTTAMLLKVGLGANVGLDPEDSEFMKLREGNTRYDLSNGTGQYFRLAAQLLRNAENKRTGKKDPFGHSLGDNLDRFTRYKYGPPAAFTRNVWEGKNAIGQKTDIKKESVELITPLFLKDLYDAYQEEGLTGVGKHAPGFVGVGVNTYGDRPKVELKPRKGSAFKF